MLATAQAGSCKLVVFFFKLKPEIEVFEKILNLKLRFLNILNGKKKFTQITNVCPFCFQVLAHFSDPTFEAQLTPHCRLCIWNRGSPWTSASFQVFYSLKVASMVLSSASWKLISSNWPHFPFPFFVPKSLADHLNGVEHHTVVTCAVQIHYFWNAAMD